MGEQGRAGEVTGHVDYIAVENSPEFRQLRSTHRRFVIPALIVGLVWYITYVVLASWADDFMSTKVWGNINWAIVIGLAQIFTTFGATLLYVWFANKKLDPEATRIRNELEAQMEGSA
jgi:uncharacterized membrane protein (DUF485 family)